MRALKQIFSMKYNYRPRITLNMITTIVTKYLQATTNKNNWVFDDTFRA